MSAAENDNADGADIAGHRVSVDVSRRSGGVPLLEGQPDVEAGLEMPDIRKTGMDMSAWKSMGAAKSDGARSSVGGRSSEVRGSFAIGEAVQVETDDVGVVGIVQEAKEWAGFGTDSDDSSDDDIRNRNQRGRSSGSAATEKSKGRSKAGTAGSAASSCPDGVDIVQQSGEWGGDFGSDSSDDDVDERREKERKARLKEQKKGARKGVGFEGDSQGGESQRNSDRIGHGRPSVARPVSKGTDVSVGGIGFHIPSSFSARFVVMTVLAVMDAFLQIWSLLIYWDRRNDPRTGSTTAYFLIPIQMAGICLSGYITFHDTDVLKFLHEVHISNPRMHKCAIIWSCVFLGCLKGIQVKRAWKRQMYAAEILTEMGDNEDTRASTPKSLSGFGGAERAIPVALLTNVPFLFVNTISALTAKWVWQNGQQWVLLSATGVALITVSIGIIEIDLAVSSYVFKRYHLNWDIVGTRAGRLQFLYPMAHVAFRASEISLRVCFFTTIWWMLEAINDSGKEYILMWYAAEYLIGLYVLKRYSPKEENLATHVVMAMLMLIADLTHFVDQPNFTVPSQKIRAFITKWRIVTMSILIITSWQRGVYIIRTCDVTRPGYDPNHTQDQCDAISQRGWVFETYYLVVAFIVYFVLRFSKPIRCIGDDLHTAAREGNVARIEKLLMPDKFNQVLDVNAFTKDGEKTTPAMFAAEGGHMAILEKLAEAGAVLDNPNKHGDTCLHLAALHDSPGHVESINFLLKKGARADCRNNEGKTPPELCKAGGVSLEVFQKFTDRSPRRRSGLEQPRSQSGDEDGITTRKSVSGITTAGTSMACEAVPLIACGSVQLRGLFPDADDQESLSPRALQSVSGLVFSRAAGLLARRVLSKQDDSSGLVPLGALRRVGELGKGGFGHVIEVELPAQKLGGFFGGDRKPRRFALKLQLKQGSQRSAFSEVLALRTVHHRFIVRLERAFQTPKFFALLLELCPTDLNRVLCEETMDGSKCKGISPALTAKYMGQTLLALTHLHNMEGGGIIYRDVKPENILISAEGDAKLTDFGLAKVVTKQERMTMCGTMGFFPPELLNCDLLETGCSGTEESRSQMMSAALSDGDSLADRSRSRSSVSSAYDPFKLDTYSYGVTLQVTLLGEDGAQRKEIRKKGFMMLPMHHSEEENLAMLHKLVEEGKLSAEGLDLLEKKLLPFRPADRSRLADLDVVNHPWFLNELSIDGKECKDTKNFLMSRKEGT